LQSSLPQERFRKNKMLTTRTSQWSFTDGLIPVPSSREKKGPSKYDVNHDHRHMEDEQHRGNPGNEQVFDPATTRGVPVTLVREQN